MDIQMHEPQPYAVTKEHFRPDDLVIGTELLAGELLHITRDATGFIRMWKQSGTLLEVVPAAMPTGFWGWIGARLGVGKLNLDPRWEAVQRCGLLGHLEHWPLIGTVQIVGVAIGAAEHFQYGLEEPTFKIVRVILDGRDQPYASFFPSWVPMLLLGKYSKERIQSIQSGLEDISGKGVHLRKGVVLRHFRLKYAEGKPLFAVICNPEVR
jgi:hypothetical protein